MYSLSLVLIWGLLFLDIDKPGQLGIFLGMIYTFYSPFLIRKFIVKENKVLLIIKFFAPVIYFASYLLMQKPNLFSFLSPLTFSIAILLISVWNKQEVPKREIQFFVIFSIYLYAYSIYPKWDKYNNSFETENSPYNFNTKSLPLDTFTINKSLFDCKFINYNLDTIQLKPNNYDYIIVETWNEKCLPCLKAIPDMNSFYNTLNDNILHIYIYKSYEKTTNLDFKSVFSFELINNNKIIFVDLEMYSWLNLSGYPYFLIFDKNGKLKFKHQGYNSNFKEEIQDSIRYICKNKK